MTPETYRDFLVSRLVERNEYGSTNALIKEIEKAKAISPETDWRARKMAFNAIAENAPLRADDSVYCASHADIPAAIERELDEFRYFGQMRLLANRKLRTAKMAAKEQAPANN